MAPLPRKVLEQAIEQINADTVSVAQLAAITGKHPDTIARYVAKGRVRSFKVANSVLIWRDDAEAAW